MNGWNEDFLNFMGIILAIVIVSAWWNSFKLSMEKGNDSTQTSTQQTVSENQVQYQQVQTTPVTNSGTPTLSGQYIPGN